MIVTGGTGPDAPRHEHQVAAPVERFEVVRTTTGVWSILIEDSADEPDTAEPHPDRS